MKSSRGVTILGASLIALLGAEQCETEVTVYDIPSGQVPVDSFVGLRSMYRHDTAGALAVQPVLRPGAGRRTLVRSSLEVICSIPEN